MHPKFINSATLAEIAGISDRAARKAIAKGVFQGHPIQTATVEGTRSHGGRRHLVISSSLPTHLQQRLLDLRTEAIEPETLRVDETGLAEHNWKLDVIRPILAQERGSSARAEAFGLLIGTNRIDWNGRRITLTKSSLYGWVRTYEESDGLHLCLAKKVRKDKGKARVVIRREWDNAVPFDAETCAAIRHEVKQYLRGLLKGGVERKFVLLLTGDKLRNLTALHGGNPDTMPSRAFDIPLDFYREELSYKKVARHKKDRKASHDAKPRIQRSIADLEPMDVVVMDVHHINVLIERETGRTATAKMIAFLDIATSRLFIEIIMFEGKGGVRNSDIITAFINMCMDPAFGLPKVLYVDNGSEYGWADHLQDALKLNIRINGFDWQNNRNPVVRATPYNAAAKHVEGVFRQLNQQLMAVIPGFIGDDRMSPKQEKLGKSMPPFPGSFDDFTTAVKKLVYGAYGWAPQYGELKGAAPLEKFKQFVDAGWTATVVDGEDLLTVFTKAKPKVVRQGRIRHENRYFTCDALNAMGDGRVTAHIPKYHGFSTLRITNAKGEFLGFAQTDRPYDVMDMRGAKESARRNSLYNRALTAMDRSVPDINAMQELIDYGERRGVVTPNAPDAVMTVTGLGGKGLMRSPIAPKEPQNPQEEEDEALAVDAARASILYPATRKAS
ncbi:transposase family protein [Rhodovulum tesquicola]|uniref:transposase family protein n=1 Tax=Rhodovulum tesquicola TaxID=540254 RepID=UPI002097E386|nr:transposase family protein [Rhodovulum tesquicola]MCO8146860.1 transposase family protein [Rhodovulum tesquicola]